MRKTDIPKKRRSDGFSDRLSEGLASLDGRTTDFHYVSKGLLYYKFHIQDSNKAELPLLFIHFQKSQCLRKSETVERIDDSSIHTILLAEKVVYLVIIL